MVKASASSRGHDQVLGGYHYDQVRIGSWNLGVPQRDSNMGTNKKHFEQWLAENMKVLNRLDLDLIVFQDLINKYWAEQAQEQLQRGRLLCPLLKELPTGFALDD